MAGKVAIITGSSRGLGKAFSRALLSRGARVCLADVHKGRGETTLEEFHDEFGKGSSIFIPCDVCDEEQFKSVFVESKKTFGQVDIVCNNAGILNEGTWKKTIDVNLAGACLGTRLAIEHMSFENGGKGGLVINMGSTAGLSPAFFLPVYSATKAGVIALTRSYAIPLILRRTGIRFNCLCPSFTDTAMIELKPGIVYDQELATQMMHGTGIQKIDPVVEAFLKLVDEDDQNGTVLTVTPHAGIRPKRYKDDPFLAKL